MQRVFGQPLSREAKLWDLLRRPDTSYAALMSLTQAGEPVESKTVAEQVEVQAKYAGYIDRQQEEIARNQRHQQRALPEDFDYAAVNGLSIEVCEKLQSQRPSTLGQAARIPGMTPAAISLLLVYLKKKAG